ncbi:MAG TPA: precorrin-4 C(11)-methyltransferase [Deltaproteobacteria bacterium]|nr:precorrin-4 C(11)-methyltransferase [Deltaproteobacteria bacterium]HQB39259.1 precorrin-4 C(11)-methyltransferase [Deltaproteobacteria bacterium]
MSVIFVGAGPGDPELLTRKAERLLRSAAVCVYAGSLINPQVLELLPANAEKYDSATMSLEETTRVCVEAHQRGLDTIRLHTGEPSIYGAILEQMNVLDKHGIDYEVVPGISSFQAAAAALKAELTAPEVSQTVILTRTSGRTPMPDCQELANLAASRATLCIYLSSHKVDEVAETLVPFYGPDCPAAIVYHASWPDQKVIKGTLVDIHQQISATDIRKTALILVGHALSRQCAESKLYDASFTHEYRQGV